MIIRKDMCHSDEDCPVNDFAHTHDLPDSYTRGFGILKDEIDPAAPHGLPVTCKGGGSAKTP